VKSLEKFLPFANLLNYVPATLGPLFGAHLPQTNLKYDEMIKGFLSKDQMTPSVTENLAKLIDIHERLIIFVDNLDRCSIENALAILEIIKEFLFVKGIIFVVAADMHMLAIAWDLRYREYHFGSEKRKHLGKEHIDKIFQLTLPLPPKEVSEIKAYIKKISSTLPTEVKNLILYGCPSNPRKIKKILNLISYNAAALPKSQFRRKFFVLCMWCILSIAYPEVADKLRKYPIGIYVIAYISRDYSEFERLFENVDTDFNADALSKHSLSFGRNGYTVASFNIVVIECIKKIGQQPELFEFFKTVSKFYNEEFKALEEKNITGLEPQIKELERTYGETLKEIVHQFNV
jgi:hypothetical protein